jgi:DNA (cytosine-5)-methyltransferase 1
LDETKLKVECILNELYNSSSCDFEIDEDNKKRVNILVDNIDNHKSIPTALITSLVKKIINPEQDIRYHKVYFGDDKVEWNKKGYSARTFDTKYITPWMKKHFEKWATKESAWLTRSIEQAHPFTLDFPGRIKNKEVKKAFLEILNDVEEHDTNPYELLRYMFFKMKGKYSNYQKLINFTTNIKNKTITIQNVIDALDSYFNEDFKDKQGTSFLPVIAIYSLMQSVMGYIVKYNGKILGDLKPHTASDKTSHSLGDIEILNNDGTRYEVFEIKHNILLTKSHIEDIGVKILNSTENNLEKYYILTTSKPDIHPKELEDIKKYCTEFLKEHNVEIIPNSVIFTIKYYLRMGDPEEFIEIFTKNLTELFMNDANIKEDHIIKWKDILGISKDIQNTS